MGKVQEELETLTTERCIEKEGLERQIECLLQDSLREKDQHILEVLETALNVAWINSVWVLGTLLCTFEICLALSLNSLFNR